MVSEGGSNAVTFGRIIEQEALKLNALCDEFLDFAKPLALNFEQIEGSEVVHRIVDSHRSQFDRAGVKLHVEVLGGAATMLADEPRIEQVLRNLLLNALQACGRGDRVRIQVGPERFVIDDSGCGMESSQIEKLFTPFFTTKAKGTGLGLSTVRKIVEAHGGRLNVESNPGKGSRFEVLLPTHEVARLRKSA